MPVLFFFPESNSYFSLVWFDIDMIIIICFFHFYPNVWCFLFIHFVLLFFSFIFLSIGILLIFCLIKTIWTITVTEVHIMSIKSGRTDYVIAGESVQLSCHYMFTKSYERVLAVNWKKDGHEVSDSVQIFWNSENKYQNFSLFFSFSIKPGIFLNTKQTSNSIIIIS